MKTNFIKVILALATFTLYLFPAFGQSPNKISYQAVVRNSSNALVTNTQVGMQISILQGSASGTAVYVETQTPTTNANGLVSIEIGGGTVVNGNFATIDWGNGLYFIKTETDINGGTTYTITGTSQLLSVPYALHSKTAESVTGGITENDPLFVASPANEITSGDITSWNNKLEVEQDSSVTNEIQALSIRNDTVFLSNGGSVKLPAAFINLTSAQINAIVSPAAGLMVYNTTIKKPMYYDGTVWRYMDGTMDSLYIGQAYQGGIIFWLDSTGQHGLIAATSNQSTGAAWGCYGTVIYGADGTAVGTGNQNTIDIENGCATSGTAADICANISLNGYTDWFLPSKDELNLLYLQKTVVGGFASAYYWSSTEYDASFAVGIAFNSGGTYTNLKGNASYVRAVRAF